MPPTLQFVLLNYTFVPVVLAALVGLVRFRQLEATRRYLVTLAVGATLVEVLSRVLAFYYIPNLWLLPADTLLECGLLAWLYRRALAMVAVSRWVPGVVAVFAVVTLVAYTDQDGLQRFNDRQRFAESVLLLGLVLLYFRKTIRELAVGRLEQEPLFWVSVGVLLYFTGSLFVFVSGNYLMERSETVSLQFWAIHAALYMVLYCFFTWALWIRPSTRR